MQKVRYEIDPFNRLVLTGSSEHGEGLPVFRRIIDGKFVLDSRNNLTYIIKSPSSEVSSVPNQVRIDGSWSLTKDHELRLTLDKEARETFGDQLTLRGRVLETSDNSLTLCLTTKTSGGGETTYLLNLQGMWRADADNRISFYVERESGRYDILVFNGAWEMGGGQKLVYRYEKASLITKKKQVYTLTFKGYWDIRQKCRISYVINNSTGSVLDFKVSAGLLDKKSIKLQVGIGIDGVLGGDEANRVISLFGSWKFAKGSGLIFEMRYGLFKKRAIVFGADIALTDNSTILFKLRSSNGEDLGLTLELENEIPGGGRVFMQALKEKGEIALRAGAAFRW